MQYNFEDFLTDFSPVMGIVPQDVQNFFPGNNLNSFPNLYNPSHSRQTSIPGNNQFLFANSNHFSRQSTTLKYRPNTPVVGNKFVSTFPPIPGSQAPGFFRRRNTTSLVRRPGRSRAFWRSASNSTNNSRVFVPKVFTTDVYPPRCQSSIQNSVNEDKQLHSFSNETTNLSRMNTSDPQPSEDQNLNSERSRIKFRPRRSKSNPNFDKTSPFNRAFKTLKVEIGLPKIDKNDAVQFLEGLVLAAFSILRTLVAELRSDIIMGMFASEDPDYDAARSYYYTNLKENVPCSGLTQRIDYTEAIENEYRKKGVLEPAKIELEGVPEYVKMGTRDFMKMTEKDFEEFLLREAYQDAPPSVSFIFKIYFQLLLGTKALIN